MPNLDCCAKVAQEGIANRVNSIQNIISETLGVLNKLKEGICGPEPCAEEHMAYENCLEGRLRELQDTASSVRGAAIQILERF